MSATISACLRKPGRVASLRSMRTWQLTSHHHPGLRLTQRARLINETRIDWAGLGGTRHLSLWPSRSQPKVAETAEESALDTATETVSSVSTEWPNATAADVTNSTLPVDAATPVADPAIFEPSFSDAVSNSIPPLQYGDLAALDLVHWTPAGFFPWLLEVIQVSTALPWWTTIVITTVGARIVLLPFIVRSMRSAARIAPIQPQLAEYRAQLARLQASGSTDKLAMQQNMLKQQAILQKAGVNPLDAVFASIAQVVVQFGFFIGLRRMCTLPVEQLKEGGFGHLLDLTVPDPFYVLPIITTALINTQLNLSGRDLAASSGPAGPHIINGFRVLSMLGVWFMAAFPAGVNIHILTSVTFMCFQTIILRSPSVRARLDLAPLPQLAPGTKSPNLRDTYVYVKDMIKRRQTAALAKAEEDRKRMMMRRR